MPSYVRGLTPSQLNYSEPAQWRQIVRQELADLRCATTAFLTQDMNPTVQTVTVQIAIQERVRPANGPMQWYDIPPITNVPVVLPRGGGFSTTLPLKKGDAGLLVFCDTCFDNWWVNGQNAAPKAANVDVPSGSQRQLEVRRHHVHDCGFLPGMSNKVNALTNYSTTSMQVRADDGSVVLDLSTAGVKITGGGTALALVNDNFYQWYVANVQPFLVSKGYVGPPVPLDSETTILKGQ